MSNESSSMPPANWTHTYADGHRESAFVLNCSCGGFPTHFSVPWEKSGILLTCARCGKKPNVGETSHNFMEAAAAWNEIALI
jgi:hypothetical protein